MSKSAQIAKIARTQGFKAAKQKADELGLGLYQSLQHPTCGQVWNKNWTRKLADVKFLPKPVAKAMPLAVPIDDLRAKLAGVGVPPSN